MLSALLLPLAVKVAATVAVVVIASRAAEAAGPFWGGLIVTLPVSAGPAYVMLAMAHDGPFIAASALASLATNAVTALFLVVLMLLAQRLRTAATLGGAIAAWAALAAVVRPVPWTLGGALVLNVAAYAAGLAVARRVERRLAGSVAPPRRHWIDLPLRALLVGAMVATVVTASSALGPAATGVLAVFPMTFTSLVLLLMPRVGGPATAATLASSMRGMIGFGLALVVLHAGVPALGTTGALCAALAVSLAWSAALMTARRLRAGRRPARA